MTDKKIIELLDGYEKKLCSLPLERATARDKIEHAIGMIPKMRRFLAEGRREKAFRWLGFLQCVFWMIDIYTIEELANHSRPTKSDLEEQHQGHSLSDFGCPACTTENPFSMGCAVLACSHAEEYRGAPEQSLPIK